MKIEAYLYAHGLLHTIAESKLVSNTTTTTVPTTTPVTTSSESNTIFQVKKEEKSEEEITSDQKKVYSILVLSLQDEQLHLIQNVKKGDAYGVWKKLIDRYERKTMASKSQARNALHKCRLEGEDVASVDKYFGQIIQLSIQLSDMGESISNGELILVLFNGLPEDCSSLIDTLSQNDKLIFEDACTSIRDRFERIKLKPLHDEEASLVKGNSNKKLYQKQKGTADVVAEQNNNNNTSGNNKSKGKNKTKGRVSM
jgi:hypothetical protein